MSVTVITLRYRRFGIQTFIDHHFYWKKYVAEKTLVSFSASLREEVNLDELNVRLITVVNETLRPERVSLWMKRVY